MSIINQIPSVEQATLCEIDTLNLACYNAIAYEYSDLSHETCRDFDAGSICFLKKAIKSHELNELKEGFNYLDVGVGTGVSLNFLYPWLESKKANIEVLDISEKMLEINQKNYGTKISTYHHVSIHNFKPLKKYSLIVSTLCDPFLTPKAINTLKNSLASDGIMLLTLPSLTWAKKVRKNNLDKTVFHDVLGNKHISFSFCWNKSDIIKCAEDIGLYTTWTHSILVSDIKKIKQLSTINLNLLLEDTKTPMLTILVLINKN